MWINWSVLVLFAIYESNSHTWPYTTLHKILRSALKLWWLNPETVLMEHFCGHQRKIHTREWPIFRVQLDAIINVVQYNMILHIQHCTDRSRIQIKSLNSQKTSHISHWWELWGVCCEDLGENWPHYNGTALYILMALCKTAVTPLLMHWSYCSLALIHWYGTVDLICCLQAGLHCHSISNTMYIFVLTNIFYIITCTFHCMQQSIYLVIRIQFTVWYLQVFTL